MFGIFKKSKATNQAKLLISVDSGAIVLYDPFNLKHRKDAKRDWLLHYADSTFVQGDRPVNGLFPNLDKKIEIPELNERLISIFHLEGDGGFDIHLSVGFEAIADIFYFYNTDEYNYGLTNDTVRVNSKEIFIGDFAHVPGGGWMPRKKELSNQTLFSLDNGTYHIHYFPVLEYTIDDIDELKELIEYDEDFIWTHETMNQYFEVRDQLCSHLLVLEKIES